MYKYYEIARNERGLKDYDVCKKTGIPPSTISDWKNGRIKTLKPDKLVLIANILNVSVDYLTTGHRTPSEPLSTDERKLLRLFRSLSYTSRTELLNYAQYRAEQQKCVEGKVG